MSVVATRELAEAQAWSRRRLAHVLVEGPTAARGEEPRRPGRAVLGGALLAVLLVGGSAVLGLARGVGAASATVEAPDLGVGVAVAAETGAAYVVLDDVGEDDGGTGEGLVARAVLNPVSARLLLPAGGEAGAVAPQTAPAAELAALAARAPGPAVGIPDAPAVVPGPTDLATTAWTACPDASAPVLADRPPEPLGAATAVLVTAGTASRLLVDARDGVRRYLLPTDPGAAETTLAALGAPPLATATPVPSAWLGLVPTGTAATLPPLAVRGGPTCLLLEPGVPGRRPDVPPTAPVTRLAAQPSGASAVTRPGAGALVTTTERPRARWFVDDRGRALPVLGAGARARLGWEGVVPVVVPPTWLGLLAPGPELSVRAAARTVDRPGS
ncbi:type VII secretion protein EccB [Nocardioides aquaticus]|uniref:type VII secretion protein EccB n=1 Tax=Nocardioides aquaticus TaxID=160826 RepID=UPI0031D2B7FD